MLIVTTLCAICFISCSYNLHDIYFWWGIEFYPGGGEILLRGGEILLRGGGGRGRESQGAPSSVCFTASIMLEHMHMCLMKMHCMYS